MALVGGIATGWPELAGLCRQGFARRYPLFDVSSLHTISCIENIYDLDVEAAQHQQIVRTSLHISLAPRNTPNDKRYELVMPPRIRATLIFCDQHNMTHRQI